jgi:hypothetical protein
MTTLTKNIIRTEADIKAIRPPAEGYVPYRDAEVGGLGLRVSSFNKRSWFLHYRCAGTQRTRNLAEWPTMTLKQARAEATQIKADAKKGIDRHAPPAPIAPVREAPTLVNLWPIYRQELVDVVEIKATTLGMSGCWVSAALTAIRRKPLTVVAYRAAPSRRFASPECVHLETRTSVVALNLAADLRLATSVYV